MARVRYGSSCGCVLACIGIVVGMERQGHGNRECTNAHACRRVRSPPSLYICLSAFLTSSSPPPTHINNMWPHQHAQRSICAQSPSLIHHLSPHPFSSAQAALIRFRRWTQPPARAPRPAPRPPAALLDAKLLPAFRSGRALRDYQVLPGLPGHLVAMHCRSAVWGLRVRG